MQVVSPQGSELLREKNIPNPKYTVRVPIPSDIDRDGGSFEVALGKIVSSGHAGDYSYPIQRVSRTHTVANAP